MFSKCKRFDERAARGSSAPGPGNYNPIHRDTIGFEKKEIWHFSKQRFNDSLRGELRDCAHMKPGTMSTGARMMTSPPRKSISVGLVGHSTARAQDMSDVTQSATTFQQARSERWRPGAPVMSTVPSHVVSMAQKPRDFSLKHGPNRNTSIQRSLDRQTKTRLNDVPSSGYGRGRSTEPRSASQWCNAPRVSSARGRGRSSVDTRSASQWCTSTRVSSRERGRSMETKSASVMHSPRVDPGTTGVSSEANVHQSRIATEAYKRYRSRKTWSVAVVKSSSSPSRTNDILDPIAEDGSEKDVVASAGSPKNTRGEWDRPRSRGRMSSGSDSSLGTSSLTIVPETRTPPSERDSQLSDNETDSQDKTNFASALSATRDVSLGMSSKSFNFTPLKEKKSAEDFNTVMDRQSRVKDTFVNQRCVEAFKQVSRGPRVQRSSSRSAGTSLTRSPTGGRLMPPVKPTLKQLAHDRLVQTRMTAQRLEQQVQEAKQRPLVVAKKAKKALQKKRSKKSLGKRLSQKSLRKKQSRPSLADVSTTASNMCRTRIENALMEEDTPVRKTLLKASEISETHKATIVKPVLRDTKIRVCRTLVQDSTEHKNRGGTHVKVGDSLSGKNICEVGQQVNTCSDNGDIEQPGVDGTKLDQTQSIRKNPQPQFVVTPMTNAVSVVSSGSIEKDMIDNSDPPSSNGQSLSPEEQHLGSRNVCADQKVSQETYTHTESTSATNMNASYEHVKQSSCKWESNDLSAQQACLGVADIKTETLGMHHADCSNGDVYYTSIPVEDIKEDGVGCKVTRLPAYNVLKDKAFSKLLSASIKKQSFTELKANGGDVYDLTENATVRHKVECSEKQKAQEEVVISEAKTALKSESVTATEVSPNHSLHTVTVLVNHDRGIPLNSYVVEKGTRNRHDNMELNNTLHSEGCIVSGTRTNTDEVFESDDTCLKDEYSRDVTDEVKSDDSSTVTVDLVKSFVRTSSNSTFIVDDRDSITSLDSGDIDQEETTSHVSSGGRGSSIDLSSNSKSTCSYGSWLDGVDNHTGQENARTNEIEFTYQTETFECGVEDAEDTTGSQRELYKEYTGVGLLDNETPVAASLSRVLEEDIAGETLQGIDCDEANTDDFLAANKRGNSAKARSIEQEDSKCGNNATAKSIEQEESKRGNNATASIELEESKHDNSAMAISIVQEESKRSSSATATSIVKEEDSKHGNSATAISIVKEEDRKHGNSATAISIVQEDSKHGNTAAARSIVKEEDSRRGNTAKAISIVHEDSKHGNNAKSRSTVHEEDSKRGNTAKAISIVKEQESKRGNTATVRSTVHEEALLQDSATSRSIVKEEESESGNSAKATSIVNEEDSKRGNTAAATCIVKEVDSKLGNTATARSIVKGEDSKRGNPAAATCIVKEVDSKHGNTATARSIVKEQESKRGNPAAARSIVQEEGKKYTLEEAARKSVRVEEQQQISDKANGSFVDMEKDESLWAAICSNLREMSTSDDSSEDHKMVSREDHKMVAVSREDHKMAAASRKDHKMAAVRREDQKMTAVSREDQKMTVVSREDQKMTAVSREDQNMVAVSRDDQKMAAVSREDHKMAAVRREDQKMAAVRREDQKMAAVRREDQKMAAAKREDQKMAAARREDKKMAAVSGKSTEDNDSSDEDVEMVSQRRGEQLLQLSPQTKRKVRKSRSQRTNVVTATTTKSDVATSRRQDTALIHDKQMSEKENNCNVVATATSEKEMRKTKTSSELEREMAVIAAQRDALALQLAQQSESRVSESEKQQWLKEIAKLQQRHMSGQRELGDVRRTLDACTKKLAEYKNFSEVEKTSSVGTLSVSDALRQVASLQHEVEANKRLQKERRRQLESTLVEAQLIRDSLSSAQNRSSWSADAHLKKQLEDLETARANHKQVNDRLEAQLFVKEIELLRAEEKMDARRVTSLQRGDGRVQEKGGLCKRVPVLQRLDAMNAEIDLLSVDLSEARTQHTRVERRVEQMTHALEEKVKRRVHQEAVVAELARTVASQERRPSYEHVGTGRWAGDVTALHVDLYHHVGAR